MSELFAAFGVNWKLIFAQAVNFGVLLLILRYFLYRPVLKMIDDRREKIAGGVKAAENADKRLAAAHAESREIVGKAAREGESIISEAKARAEKGGWEILKAAQSRSDALIAETSARAEEAKRQAIAASEREIAKAAMLAAEKILREKPA